MNKKEEFKQFINNHPELIESVNSGKMTWQKYYELYDLFGDDTTKWEPYLNSSRAGGVSLGGITSLIKKVNVNSINKHVNTAQKAINLFQELSSKKTPVQALTKGPAVSRPINKIFED